MAAALHQCLCDVLAARLPSLPARFSDERKPQTWVKRALERVFGIEDIPSPSQMREILSGAPTRRLREVLPEVFERARLRAVARSTTRWHLTSSEYFHSTKINCPGDSRRESKDGVVAFPHVVVGATLLRAALATTVCR